MPAIGDLLGSLGLGGGGGTLRIILWVILYIFGIGIISLIGILIMRFKKYKYKVLIVDFNNNLEPTKYTFDHARITKKHDTEELLLLKGRKIIPFTQQKLVGKKKDLLILSRDPSNELGELNIVGDAQFYDEKSILRTFNMPIVTPLNVDVKQRFITNQERKIEKYKTLDWFQKIASFTLLLSAIIGAIIFVIIVKGSG